MRQEKENNEKEEYTNNTKDRNGINKGAREKQNKLKYEQEAKQGKGKIL